MLEPTAREKNRIIVFIAGYAPTKEERALAEKHNTGVFLTTIVPSPVVPHKRAVAVEGVQIPKGFTTELVEAAKPPEAPKTNPTAPAAPAGSMPALGTLGQRPEGLDTPPASPAPVVPPVAPAPLVASPATSAKA